MFKNPGFWYRFPTILEGSLLLPLSLVYAYFARKNYQKDYDIKLENQKVIAVGGLTVGGSGKTMVTKFIADALTKKGKKVAILSRGYGRISDSIMQVDPEKDSYKKVGDEPLLLAQSYPVYVGKNRAESAYLAGDAYDYFILDDGVVQRYLKPDIRILVVDGKQGIGNGYMLPLGPNRLRFSWIKSDMNALISFGNFPTDFSPVFHGNIRPHNIEGSVIAFCGLGYPQKFFDSLSNCSLVKSFSFPDHYAYKKKDISFLLDEKRRLSAKLVTTMKDFVKIPASYRSEIIPLNAEPEIPDFTDWIYSNLI